MVYAQFKEDEFKLMMNLLDDGIEMNRDADPDMENMVNLLHWLQGVGESWGVKLGGDL